MIRNLWAETTTSSRHPEMDGYASLAAALLLQAATDYHRQHHPALHRRSVMSSKLSSLDDIKREIERNAEKAGRWMKGEYDWALSEGRAIPPNRNVALFPFWLASEWVGWDQATLADFLMSGRTGDHIYEQYRKGIVRA